MMVSARYEYHLIYNALYSHNLTFAKVFFILPPQLYFTQLMLCLYFPYKGNPLKASAVFPLYILSGVRLPWGGAGLDALFF